MEPDKTVSFNFKNTSSRLFLLKYGFYLSVTQQWCRKYFSCSVFPQGFYIHQFHAAPNIQSVLNPQVNSEMSHNLLLLQYYQSKSRRVQAVYRHFLLSIPTFFFYSCSFQGCLRGDEQPSVSFSAEETASRGSAAQLTHKRLKNLIFCSLVNVTSDSYHAAFKPGSHFQTVSGQMTNAIKEKSFDSHGIFIDHNTAFWYVLLEGALSPEYQWSPTDRQIEWEYHQGPIHISYFMFFYCSLFSSVVFNSDSHCSFSAVSFFFCLVYFNLFSLLLLSSLTFSCPTNVLCVIMEHATVSQRSQET